ncbi:MAG: hypothetical protein HZB98_14615 [Bacteroidia bacterium]|nr:hypothetical protein [Bacteroidia bacterium]
MKMIINARFIPAIILLLLIINQNAGAQGIDINERNRKGLYLGLNISPVKTSIINNGTTTIVAVESTPATSISSNLEIGYSLSSYLAFSSGIGFIIYNSSFDLANYTNSYDTIDSESESYKRNISGNGITETQKITFLTIPLVLNVSIPVSEIFGFFVKPGINLLLHMNSAYDNTGNFDYSGYYSKYNVTISDVPFEGFKVAVQNIGSGEPMIKSLNYEFIASAGAELKLQRNLRLTFGADYRKILSAISDYPSSSSYKLSTKPGQMNSFMAGCEDVSASAFGISVGLRYYIK